VASVTDSYDRILGFIDWSCYFFLSSSAPVVLTRLVEHIPDSLLLGKSGRAGNRARTSGSVARNFVTTRPQRRQVIRMVNIA
jgi:hypothetical protein